MVSESYIYIYKKVVHWKFLLGYKKKKKNGFAGRVGSSVPTAFRLILLLLFSFADNTKTFPILVAFSVVAHCIYRAKQQEQISNSPEQKMAEQQHMDQPL